MRLSSTVPVTTCPDDFLPGLVLRWTVTGDQLGTEEKHPDDLVVCPRCMGRGIVRMVPSDFTDWEEAVPDGVCDVLSN